MKPPPSWLPRLSFYLTSALVGVLSLVPRDALPAVPIGDKIEHGLAYVALALVGVTTSKRSAARALVPTILGVSLFGIVLELLQAFSPGRSPDIVACLGGVGALALRSAASTAIDKLARAAEPCRARADGVDKPSASDVRTTRSS